MQIKDRAKYQSGLVQLIADVHLQLGSEDRLQDIQDVAFFRKLQRLGSYTFGSALSNAMKQSGLLGIDA